LAEPEHDVRVPAFLIARYETTIADYIEFLITLPSAERAARSPRGRRQGLSFSPEGEPVLSVDGHSLRQGEPLCRPGRRERACQDWSRLPVSSITPGDADAYISWLARGRVPTARRCTEHEWERAARGADGRRYPFGEAIQAGDANVEDTYGADPALVGADAVGSYPSDCSPFGVFDLAGNVAEWTGTPTTCIQRGGLWDDAALHAQSVTRAELTENSRGYIGVRVCADVAGTGMSVSSTSAQMRNPK
jgi:formylglycine-generating enzyme required for sulfatase activity